MNERLTRLFDYLDKLSTATPNVIADLKKLYEDVTRPFAEDSTMPTTIDELKEYLIGNDNRLQAQRDFLVSPKVKKITHATIQEITEAVQPSLTGVLSRLS